MKMLAGASIILGLIVAICWAVHYGHLCTAAAFFVCLFCFRISED